MGFLPEAFVNMLAMLGWNDGSGEEIFTLPELVERFSIERIQKGTQGGPSFIQNGSEQSFQSI
jgi:glutamyl/glutaminyl-tRNA synthetase